MNIEANGRVLPPFRVVHSPFHSRDQVGYYLCNVVRTRCSPPIAVGCQRIGERKGATAALCKPADYRLQTDVPSGMACRDQPVTAGTGFATPPLDWLVDIQEGTVTSA